MENANIAVVIVSFNALKWIPKCLASLKGVSVYVVDNGSTDGTLDYIEQHFPQVYIIKNRQNTGFGAANNQGILEALNQKADYVLLLNQDAWLHKGTTTDLVNLLRENENLGIVSPVHLDGKAESLDYGFYEYLAPTNCPSYLCDVALGQPKDIYSIRFVNAAAWMIPSTVFKKVGLFHPAFFHYGEDDEFIHRLRRFGFDVAICPTVFICHDRPQKRSTTGHFSVWERMKRRYLIEVFNHDDPLKNYIILKKSLIKSAGYSFLRGRIKKGMQYLKVIPYLKKRIHLKPEIC